MMSSRDLVSRKKTVLQKYRTEFRDALSQCIEDVLPDLESSGAITTGQSDQVREYVDGKMPANAVDYLMDEHMERLPMAAEIESFMKLLEVMKGAGSKCTPRCKGLATVVEQHLVADTSRDKDQVTKMLEKLAIDKTKQLQELIDGHAREWKKWGICYIQNIGGYKPHGESRIYSLTEPMFLAKGPGNEVFVRDHATHRIVVFKHSGEELKYSRYIDRKENFRDITGIAASKDYLYVADYMFDCVQVLKIQNGECVQSIGSSGKELGQFTAPFGLALDEGKAILYVCDCFNNRIQIVELDNNAVPKTFKEFTGKLNYPKDIALNYNKDQLYVTDEGNHRVQVFKTDGKYVGVFGDDYVKGILRDPFGICCGVQGRHVCIPFTNVCAMHTEVVLISDRTNNQVYKVRSDGMYLSTLEHDFKCPCGVIMMDNEQIVVANKDGYADNKLTVI